MNVTVTYRYTADDDVRCGECREQVERYVVNTMQYGDEHAHCEPCGHVATPRACTA